MKPLPPIPRPPPPAHVVWDWNGTLLDDTAACVQAINRLLAERDLPVLDETRYRAAFGFPVRDFYAVLGFDLAHEDWDALAERFHAFYLADPSPRIRPEGRAALAWVEARGIPQSLLSACEQRILDAHVERAGLRHLFRNVAGVDNLHGHSKLELGRRLLATLASPPSRIVVVGDTLHDHEVAASLGCACILVANGHQNAERLQATGRPVIASLADLPPLLAP